MKYPKLIHGYRTVNDIPICPCNDPGNYMMLEQTGPLEFRYVCWCGRRLRMTVDNEEDATKIIKESCG